MKTTRSDGLFTRARLALADSAWAPIAGKAAGYLLGLALLAAVGSGHFTSWLTPAGRPAIGVAQAATAIASASASASASQAAAPSELPDAGEAVADAASPAEARHSGVDADGKVLLNLATEEELRRLPGVGPKKAKAIVELRTRMKRFGRLEDLLKIKGMGRRSLARLRPLVKID